MKSQQTEPTRQDVWRMFNRIAPRYDFLNHFLSFNRDVTWRRAVADLLPPGDNLRVLDLASGTGDQLLALYDSGRVRSGVGIDPAVAMLEIGRKKISERKLESVLCLKEGSAEHIDSEDRQFDAVSMAFGIRNVTDVGQSLNEIFRVLKPGGRALILEFSLPGGRINRAGYLFYLRHILPYLGSALSGDSAAYRYLNQTVETFPHGEVFCQLMREGGFRNVTPYPMTLGVATIYQGDR